MNLTYFHPQKRGNVENIYNNPVNIRFVAKTSDIGNFSENIRSDVKTSEVATLTLIPFKHLAMKHYINITKRVV